jgi:hypothetical protein
MKPPLQLPYGQVDYRVQACGYIFMPCQLILNIPVCGGVRILVLSVVYYVVLCGDSSKGTGFKIVDVILCNYHSVKLVTGNKHLVTYSGHGISFSPHFV